MPRDGTDLRLFRGAVLRERCVVPTNEDGSARSRSDDLALFLADVSGAGEEASLWPREIDDEDEGEETGSIRLLSGTTLLVFVSSFAGLRGCLNSFVCSFL